MRASVVFIVFLLSGCAAVDAPDERSFHGQEGPTGFTASYADDDGCWFEMMLRPGEPVARADLWIVDAWLLEWSFGGPGGGCIGTHGVVALDERLGIIREAEQWCWIECYDVSVDFGQRGGLPPFGVAWPMGDTQTVATGTPIPVTVVQDGAWSRLDGLPTTYNWVNPDFRFQPGQGPVPDAFTWAIEGEVNETRVMHLQTFEWTEPLPTQESAPPIGGGGRDLLEVAPGADLDAYHFGFSLDDAVAAAVEEDATFAEVLADGCLSMAASHGRGRGWAGLGEYLHIYDTERVDLTLEARSPEAVRRVEVSYVRDRFLIAEIPEDPPTLVAEGPMSEPGECPDLQIVPMTIEGVRDALWELPILEDHLPCTWSVIRPAPLVPGHGRMWITVSIDGFAHTGTFWNHWPEGDESPFPERWAHGSYDLVNGGWMRLYGLTWDEVAALDAKLDGDRVVPEHDDSFQTWCRYEETESVIPPVPPL